MTRSAEDAFGETGNPELDIGNKDRVLIIVDLVSGSPGRRPVRHAATGARRGCPPLKFKKDGSRPASTSKGAPKPTDKLAKAVLLEGEGPVGREGRHGRRPLPRPGLRRQEAVRRELQRAGPDGVRRSAAAQVIKGWDKALVGATVGTRMVIEVPPDLGYGKEGNPDAGIKGTDTLVLRHRRARRGLSRR